MTKHLPLLILLLFFFTGVDAQDTTDSIKHAPTDTVKAANRTDSAKAIIRDTVKAVAPVDSVKKVVHTDTIKNAAPPDSLVKKQLLETVKDMPSDSVVRLQRAEFLKKQTADSLARIERVKMADSLSKKMVADSLLKKGKTDSVTQQKPADDIQKVIHADSIGKRDNAAGPAVIRIMSKKAMADSVSHVPKVKPVTVVKPPSATTKPPAPDPTKHSTVKTLSDKKYLGYMNGDDMDDMSLVGEMNHYPLPDKALKYKAELQLNPGQIAKLKDIVTNLIRKKKEMGQNIITNERTLDTLFKSHQIVDGTIIFYTNRYGLYLGELRNAILQACFKTRDILSEAQIKKLEALASK